jgi:zinc transport system permease protein
MFGSILALGKADLIWSICLFLIVVPIFTVLFNKIFSVTFDPSFATATGIRVKIFDSVIAVLTAVTIVIGMRLMGTLLISALIVFPVATAMRVMKSFKGVVIFSGVLPLISFTIGLTASYFLSTPAGASVVCVNLILFLTATVVGAVRKAKK